MTSTDSGCSSPQIPDILSGSIPNDAEQKTEPSVPSFWYEDGLNAGKVRNYIYQHDGAEEGSKEEGSKKDGSKKDRSRKDGSEEAKPAKTPSVSQFWDTDCGSWQNAPNSKCHASFGDHGTTATVGAFGQLLQFSKFLGAGSSGMFSVDHLSMPEPFFVTSRAEELHGLSQQPFHYGHAISDDQPYGLRFPELRLKSEAKPELKWTHWRWPRHEYSRGDFEDCPELKRLSIQWMVHDKVILQQCVLEYDVQKSVRVDVEFSKSMMIRDLDYLDPGLDFNEEETRNHDSRPGPGGYSWVCVHKFNTELDPEDPRKDDLVQGTSAKILSSRSNVPGRDSLQGLGDTLSSDVTVSADEVHRDTVVVSSDSQKPRQQGAFEACETVEDRNSLDHLSDSSARSRTDKTPQPEQSIHHREAELKKSYGVSVTASVAINGELQVFEGTIPQKWEEWTIPVDNSPTSGTHARAQTLEVTVAYKMHLLEAWKTDWKNHVIPRHDMRVRDFLQKQATAQPLPLCIRPPFRESMADTVQTREDFSNDGCASGSRDTSLLKNNEDDHTTRIPWHYVPPKNPVGTPGKSSQHKPGALHSYLEFASRRNLEHILAVCAVQATPYLSHVDVAFPDDLHNVKAVALTCGDMSGHRICWSASFFAFQFLVESYKSLRGVQNARRILKRIEETCLGHLKWLHLAQQQESEQRFGANYWPTGRLMERTGNTSWAPGESLLDTAFQILKAAACMELWPDNKITAELMSDWTPSWLLSMEKLDRRKKHAWPHAKDHGVNTFRLDDHVWIWRALKSLESCNHLVWNRMSEKASTLSQTGRVSAQETSRPGDSASTRDVPSSPFSSISGDLVENLRITFASQVVQREASNRFTTFNDVLQKRMLAVTRSSKETRFMLHAHDTALFYREASDFFLEDTSVKELWESTISCQVYHEENRDLIWEKSMRYALCIMMGIQGLNINNRPSDDLVRTATDTLISSSSPNGFFPGRLQFQMNQPLQKPFPSKKERDSYYRVSFEIPFVLLTHGSQISDIYDRSATDPTKSTSKPQRTPGRSLQRSKSMPAVAQAKSDVSLFPIDTQRRIFLPLSNDSASQSRVPWPDCREMVGNVRQAMKKALLFNNLIDYNNIVKLEDEWLFDYPEFFTREEDLKSGNYDNALGILEKRVTAPKTTGSGTVFDSHGDDFYAWVRRAISKLEMAGPIFQVVDVPSSKLIEGKRKDRQPQFAGGTSYKHLREFLSPPRTAQNSKKRLLYFHVATVEVASVCYAATEVSEQDSIADFFERHAHYEKHAIDQCSLAHNTWETELHLSYYQLVEGSSASQPSIPKFELKPFPGDCEKHIFRASASFRFKGDFFDRYWTCYMLEHVQNGPISTPRYLREKEYRQRKVLEQKYFADILTNLVESIDNILAEVKHCLGVKLGSFTTSIASTNAYLAWSALWQKFKPLLNELDDDLQSTQVIVDQWETREEDRGQEKPRWTPDDERKYRASITKLHREIKHQTSKLQHLHANINLLRESCSNRLVRAREELSFRSEQNIATFTYVTVVFLPLGFAASIFSMSETPEKGLVINMVVASVIALAVTILALLNAKDLAGVVENITTSFKDITAKAKQSSVMMRDLQNVENEANESNLGHRKTPRLHVSSANASLWNLVFWTGYIFMELPSRSITVACRILGWPRNDDEDLEGLKECKRVGPFARSAVASGIRYCLVPSMPYLGKEAAVVLGRSSMELPREPAPQLVEEDKLRRDGYGVKVARVTLGVFMIPVFLPAWILQVLCFNAWDVLALLGELIHQGIKQISLPEIDGSESSLMDHLTKPPEKMRPMKIFKDHLRSKKKPPEGAENLVSSLEKLSQAAQ